MKIPTILTCITWHRDTLEKQSISSFDQLSFHRGNTMRGGRVYYTIIHQIVYRSIVGQTVLDLYRIIGGLVPEDQSSRIITDFADEKERFGERMYLKKKGGMVCLIFCFVNISIFFKKCFFSRSVLLRIIKMYYLE